MLEVSGVSNGTFRITARVPEDMVSLPADGDWAAWFGVACVPAGDRQAIAMVSIAVTAFDPPDGEAGSGALAAMLRARHPDAAVIDELAAPDGRPAAGLRRVVTQRVNGRKVTTGQAQALVAYPEPRALGVVSGICLHPDDLDMTAALVDGIAARLTVTAAAAAA